VNKRLLLDIGKYVLAAGLLVWVVRSNWAPPTNTAVATLAASTVGLSATSGGYGPLVAAASALPERTEPRGLGYVWKRHVVQRQPIQVGFLAAAFTLYATAVLVTFFRWYLLVRALDLPLKIRDAMRLGLIGIFFSGFLPGSVGGDVIKGAVLARGQKNRRTAAFATVIMDRGIGLWAMVWFVAVLGSIFWLAGLFVGPSAGTASVIVAIAVAIVVVSIGGWLLLGLLPEHRAQRFAGRLTKLRVVGHAASEFWRAVWMYRQKQKCVAVVMLLTCIGQIGFVLAFYCGAYALWSPEQGPVPSLMQHFLLVPLGLVLQALVPTPGGAGGGEWVFGALYMLFSAAEANGVLASLVRRLIDWTIGLLGYLIYLWTSPEKVVEPVRVPSAAPIRAELAVSAPTTSAMAR
jgi:uncharacterized protein (TIRG00374 family)